MKKNYQKEMDALLAVLGEQEPKRLLLHSCCAPCSSYVLEYLSDYFKITVLYFNPNITNPQEYEHRLNEQRRLCSQMPLKYPVEVCGGSYEPRSFLDAVKGFEKEPERGARCEICFRLRLQETARLARLGGYDYFATTLTLSPLKNAPLINEIGEELGREYGVKYLCSDFKKKEGYKRSIKLSAEYGLYRQNYCGCVFSKTAQSAEEQR